MRRITSALLLLVAACGDSGPVDEPCVKNLDLNCAALYDPPTYTALFQNILHPTCASGHGTCHTSDFAPRGLIFEDQQQSYGMLMGTIGGKQRVIPGDPSCSLLIRRLESQTPSYRMPPGNTSLTQPQLCTFVKWIAQGAQP
jgi:hypothetical protein